MSFKKKIIGKATLYCGNSLDIMRDLPCVDALITDPPYSSGGATHGTRTQTPQSKYVGNNAAHNVNFFGDNRDARSWAFWTTQWLTIASQRVRPGGYSMVFTDWRQLPALTDAYQAGGFIWRGVIPWNKTLSSRAPHKGYFRHQCEYIVWGSNGALAKATHGGPWPGCITERVIPSEKHHMTGKPVKLMAELVKAIPPKSVILDPFMGSGSTGVAAVEAGYEFIGIEMSEHYFNIACERLEKAQTVSC